MFECIAMIKDDFDRTKVFLDEIGAEILYELSSGTFLLRMDEVAFNACLTRAEASSHCSSDDPLFITLGRNRSVQTA